MSYGHNKDFVVKDSGERINYQSGMRRDTQKGKPNYRLIDIPFLTRIADHLVKGAEKYGRDNWRLANSQEELDRFLDSGFRHLMQYLNGDTDEDHMAAVCFNLMAAEHVKRKMSEQQISSKKNRTDDTRDAVDSFKTVQPEKFIDYGYILKEFDRSVDHPIVSLDLGKLFGYGARRPKENFVQPEDGNDTRDAVDSFKTVQPKKFIDYGYILKEFERLTVDHPIVSLDLHHEGLAKFTFLWPKYQTKILIPIEELETVFDIEAVIMSHVISINNDYIDKKLGDILVNLA